MPKASWRPRMKSWRARLSSTEEGAAAVVVDAKADEA